MNTEIIAVADRIIISVQAGYLPAKGLEQLMATMRSVL